VRQRALPLDLLGSSCLVLTRISVALGKADRPLMAPSVRGLAATLGELAAAQGDRQTRQRAAARALAIARELDNESGPARIRAAARSGARMVAADIMIFAGVIPDGTSSAVPTEAGGPT
jgi:hypothetical protein